jgi:RHS repeat-associated protein
VGVWEQFQLVDAGGGFTALIARANGMYVCAESAGATSLIANRSAFGAWETFRMVSLLSAVPAVHYELDAASRMTSVQTNGGETTVSFGYDRANRQIWEEQTLLGYPTRRVETPLDGDGNRHYLNVPNWYYVDYQYTGRNQLKAVNGFASFAYDPNGNLTNRTSNWLYPSGTSYFFDQLNRVTQIDHGNAWFIFSRPHFQYDSVGREIATWRDEQSGKGEHFWFTATNQLAVVEYNADQVWTANPQNCDRWVGYNYTSDLLNRQSVNDNGMFTNYAVSQMNQYSVNGATYDGNFNLTDFGGFHGVYDAENHLVGGSMHATYDGLGRCVRRTTSSGTSLFTYDGWKPILEWDAAGNWVATNVYGAGPDEILARQDSNGRMLIYKQDQHGNVVAVMSDNGDVTEKYTFDAFGKPSIFDKWGNGRAVTAIGNRFMFQGREWISELGIYDYRHRMYQPDLGRFLQTDPTGFDAGDMNLFRYCGDDPVDGSDPLGLYKIDPRGLTSQQFEEAEEAQKATANLVASAAARVDQALVAGADSKEFKSVKEGYEKVNGKGSATEKNLREFSKTARRMETALRDDGSKGYLMTAHNQDWFVKKWNDARVLGDGDIGGKTIRINADKVFKSK